MRRSPTLSLGHSALVLLLLTACESSVTRFDLPLQEDTKAALFAIEDGEQLTLYGIDLEQSPWIQFDLPEGNVTDLTVLLYPNTLEQLGIAAGVVEEDPRGCRIPQPDEVFVSPSAPEITWQKGELMGRLDTFRLSVNKYCVELGGCLNSQRRCAIPCTEPTIDPPQIEPAVLPILLPCPTGWLELEEAGVPYCAPWATPPSCSGNTAPFPGGSGCALMGFACPHPGPFPSEASLPSGTLIYVDASSTDPQPDGTRGHPYATIGQALAGFTQTATIVLSAGDYQGPFSLPAGASLLGACMSTVIEGAALDDEIVVVRQHSGTISNLKIRNGDNGVVVRGGRVQLRDLIIEDTNEAGVEVSSEGSVSATRLLVRGSNHGIRVANGARFDGRRVVTSSCTTRGILAEHDATLELRDVAVLNTHRPPGVNNVAVGIFANVDTDVVLRRVVVDHSRDKGVDVRNSSTLDAEDLIIRDTYDDETNVENIYGRGLRVWKSSIGTIRRLVILKSKSWAFRVDVGTPEIDLQDALLVDSRGGHPDDGDGMGMILWDSKEISLFRVYVGDSREAAIWLGRGAAVEISDLTVEGVRELPEGQWGAPGIYVNQSQLVVDRLAIRDVEGTCIYTDRGTVRLSDATVSLCGSNGIHAVSSTVTVTDGRFSETEVSLLAVDSNLVGHRLELEKDGSGIESMGTTSATIDHLRAAGSDRTTGATLRKASLELRHFAIQGHAIGVSALDCQGWTADQLRLEEGLIEGAKIGLEVEDECIGANDMAAVSIGVSYRDNDRAVVRR